MKVFFISLVCFALAGIFSLPAYGQSGPVTLTVEESVRRGLEYHHRLRGARADAEEAEAAYRQAQAGLLPVIRGQASYTRLSDNIPEVDFTIPGTDSTFTVLPVELNQFHTELSIEQPLFTGGRRNNEIEAAARRADAAGLMEEQEQADAAFEIRQAYWELYRAQVEQESLTTALEQMDEHLREVRARVDEGTLLRTELLNAETRRSEVLLDQVEARSRVRVARLDLNRLTGLPADSETEVIAPGEPAEQDHFFEMEDVMELVLERRPGLHALSEQVKAREAEIRAIQGGWLPEVSLVGRYIHARPNQYFFAEQDRFRGTWEAGVALRWNIWSGGQRVHETGRAKARLRSAEAGLAGMRDQVQVDAARQYLEMERSGEAISVARAGMETAEESFRLVQLQFEEGTALPAEVLDAEYAYRNAVARYAQAVSDYEISRASVLNVLGQVWEGQE